MYTSAALRFQNAVVADFDLVRLWFANMVVSHERGPLLAASLALRMQILASQDRWWKALP